MKDKPNWKRGDIIVKGKKMSKKKSVRAKPKNKLDWDEQYGYWSYCVDGETIYDLNEVSINGKKYKVVEGTNESMEYEMGHRSLVRSTKYFIRAKVEGVYVPVDLVHIMIKKTVTATKFSTEKPTPAVRRRNII
jgi:hypothetical protein